MLRTFFDLAPGAFPCFDLLLGMGPDGHTASLFPTTAAVHEHTRLVVAPWVEKFKTSRITMTPPVLCNVAHVVFAAGGADKAETLGQVSGDTSRICIRRRLSNPRMEPCCGWLTRPRRVTYPSGRVEITAHGP